MPSDGWNAVRSEQLRKVWDWRRTARVEVLRLNPRQLRQVCGHTEQHVVAPGGVEEQFRADDAMERASAQPPISFCASGPGRTEESTIEPGEIHHTQPPFPRPRVRSVLTALLWPYGP